MSYCVILWCWRSIPKWHSSLLFVVPMTHYYTVYGIPFKWHTKLPFMVAYFLFQRRTLYLFMVACFANIYTIICFQCFPMANYVTIYGGGVIPMTR